jgi:polyhydroxyalkanoate synthesis regulator phasin
MPETERATTTAERLREMMRDTFTLMLGAASWATEEGERLIRQWMDRGEVSREEGKRMLEQLKEQARKSRDELSRVVAEGVRNASANVPVATREQVAALERRVEELTKEIESLKASSRS